MTYEVKTPQVAESIEAARAAIRGILDGSMEVREANGLCTGARAIQTGVGIDIKARLAEVKLAAMEAKQMEARRGETQRVRG